MEGNIPPLIEDIIKSPIFDFVVGSGPNTQRFSVHSKALEYLSDSLYAMINGNFNESKTGQVYFPNVLPSTFEKIVSIGMLGDYHIERSESEIKECARPEKQSTETDDIDMHPSQPDTLVQATQATSLGQSTAEELERLGQQMSPGSTKSTRTKSPDDEPVSQQPRAPLSPRFGKYKFKAAHRPRDFTDVDTADEEFARHKLLSHGRVYLFADQYDIESVRQLAMSKIHDMLWHRKEHHVGVSNILDFARFVYAVDETGTPNTRDADPLRVLVIKAIFCYIKDFDFLDELPKVMREGGDLAADLVMRMRKGLFHGDFVYS